MRYGKVAVVVPAHNEERYVAQVIRTVPDFVDLIVAVDDASTDRTHEILQSIKDPRLRVVRNDRRMGVGGAIVRGHKEAMALGSDINVVMAGDGQMDPRYLEALVRPIFEEGYDFTKGNRFTEKDSLRGMPRLRVLGNAILGFLTKAASGYWHIFDPQNGYTAITVSALKRIDLDDVAKDFQFENDLLVRLNVASCRTRDVAIPAVYGNQQSKLKVGSFAAKTSLFLVRAFWWRVYRRYMLFELHPFAVLLVSGLLMFVFGLLLGTYMLYLRFWHWPPVSATAGTVMVAAVPFFLGVQLLVNALLLDIMESRRLA